MTLHREGLIELHRAMFLSREIDRLEEQYVRRGVAHFHVSGAGHESTALLAEFLRPDDWLHLHYRDKALLLARGLPPVEFFRAFLATAGSLSAGRQMNAHLSARHLNVMSMVGPVGNNALQAVGVAQALRDSVGDPLVVCSVGDGTTQQGEFLEAVAEAARGNCSVLFLVQDNGYSISVPTGGKTFFDLRGEEAASLFGVPIHYADGINLEGARKTLGGSVALVRQTHSPSIVVLKVARHSNHTNGDDQSAYRSADEIAGARRLDPLQRIRDLMAISQIDLSQQKELEHELTSVADAALLEATKEVGSPVKGPAKAPYTPSMLSRGEYRGDASRASLTMREALNVVLSDRLANDPRVHLLGEDIEDPKGDVFGVTRGLSTAFPGRVQNTALSEATIIGTAVGRALAGQRPVAFIQFADFLHLGMNQIASEMASMFWRSNGTWEAPLILMVSCGGYKPGLGPFHAQTLEGTLAHIPGIDVVMPSNAGDAAGLLNAAFASARPTVFLYPKARLNLASAQTSPDIVEHFVLPGRATVTMAGRDLTIVSYGNCVGLCLEVAEALANHGKSVEVVDLRSISPLDIDTLVRSVHKTGRLVVVHEDNITGGFGAEIVAQVSERLGPAFSSARVAREDAWVPFNFDAQLDALPSYRSIMMAAARLLDFDVVWQVRELPHGLAEIVAIGSGPSDDEVEVAALLVRSGDRVDAGQMVALLEATKAVVEVDATVSGEITALGAAVGQKVRVGHPLFYVKLEGGALGARSVNNGTTEQFNLVPKASVETARRRATVDLTIGVVAIAGALGDRVVTNADLAQRWPHRGPQSIAQLTGIESRRWVGAGQTTLSLAVDATRKLLSGAGLRISDIDLVIAASGTPDMITPSLAFRVAEMCAGGDSLQIAAYDVNAACSGYLYALGQAHDYLATHPDASVLVVTAEVLSPLVDPTDFDTAIIFADGATASLVRSVSGSSSLFTFETPVLSGEPSSSILQVPLQGNGYIQMDGRQTFVQAVRAMGQSLGSACERGELALSDLALIVPHQANARIIEALERRSSRPTYSAIRHTGNTSSSSIPLALQRAVSDLEPGQRFGLVAFGGGASYGAAIATRGGLNP